MKDPAHRQRRHTYGSNLAAAAITAAFSGVVAAVVTGGFLLYSQQSTESARQDFVQVQLRVKELGEARVQLRYFGLVQTEGDEPLERRTQAQLDSALAALLYQTREQYLKAEEVYLHVGPLLQEKHVVREKYELAKSLQPKWPPLTDDGEEQDNQEDLVLERVRAEVRFIDTLRDAVELAYAEAMGVAPEA